VGFWAIHYRRKPPENGLHPPEIASGRWSVSGSVGRSGFHTDRLRVLELPGFSLTTSLSRSHLSVARAKEGRTKKKRITEKEKEEHELGVQQGLCG
jgi:hypothetical protein